MYGLAALSGSQLMQINLSLQAKNARFSQILPVIDSLYSTNALTSWTCQLFFRFSMLVSFYRAMRSIATVALLP